MDQANWLSERILDFMDIVNRCLEETSYAQDRTYYAKDLAFCAKWLIMLHKGKEIEDVINLILDDSSSKFFYDMYKEGEYGDMEALGFKNLQATVSSKLNG